MATPTLLASGVCDEYQYTLMMLAWDLDKDTHEYFSHKYNISNDIKESLNSFAKNFKLMRENNYF